MIGWYMVRWRRETQRASALISLWFDEEERSSQAQRRCLRGLEFAEVVDVLMFACSLLNVEVPPIATRPDTSSLTRRPLMRPFLSQEPYTALLASGGFVVLSCFFFGRFCACVNVWGNWLTGCEVPQRGSPAGDHSVTRLEILEGDDLLCDSVPRGKAGFANIRSCGGR